MSVFTYANAFCVNSNNSSLTKYTIFNITNGQIYDGLNALYEDFKNTSITITDAIYVVKKQISGTPPEDIDRIFLYLRSGKVSDSTLWVYDEKGALVKKITLP